MRRKLPEIKESVDELKERLRTEKRARMKQRIQMLYLLKTGTARGILDVALTLAVDRATIRRWLKWYESQGLERMLEIRTKPNRQALIGPAVLEALRERLQNPEGFSSYKEIHLWLKQKQAIDIAYRTVHEVVRYKLGAKPKMARPEHVKKTRSKHRSLRTALEES